MLTLAAHGIAVAPGRAVPGGHLDGDHVRVTAGLVRDGFDDLADVLAAAAGARRRGSGPRPARTRAAGADPLALPRTAGGVRSPARSPW